MTSTSASVSRWDELPADIQDKLITMRTRLHFADCMNELETTGPRDKRAAVIRSIMKKSCEWHILYMADDSYTKGPGKFIEFVLGNIQVFDGEFFRALLNGATFHELYYMDYKVKCASVETWRCNLFGACVHTEFPLNRRKCRFATCHETCRKRYTLGMLEDLLYTINNLATDLLTY